MFATVGKEISEAKEKYYHSRQSIMKVDTEYDWFQLRFVSLDFDEDVPLMPKNIDHRR